MKAKTKAVCAVTAIIALITGGVVKGNLIVSPLALEIMGNAEGCRLEPYVCPSGLITNGIGNTHQVKDEPVTDRQVAEDWVRNINAAEKCLISSSADKPMSQGQIDAFTSFIFNTGCTRFKHNVDGQETRIYQLIHSGDYNVACGELKFWVYGAGKKLPGLVARRRKEEERCLAN